MTVDLADDADRPAPLYSICVTCRNSIRTIKRSMTSILSQLDDRFEVIVVDGGSSDGTVEAVRRLQRKYGTLFLFTYPCSRGLGRHIAYRRSRGKYLIQGGDTDIIFQPTLRSILDYYHGNEKVFGKYALFIPEALLICTREIMDDVGGWPDLQCDEDVYIGAKLMRVCTVERNSYLYNLAVKEHVKSLGKGRLSRAKERYYIGWRDFHRYLPFSDTIKMLRAYLKDIRFFPLKLGIVAMFLLGALGQYSKSRYKLSGDNLKFHMKFYMQFYKGDYKPIERFVRVQKSNASLEYRRQDTHP
jgi:glycosyltransferase involved in cell wall biosynthesis